MKNIIKSMSWSRRSVIISSICVVAFAVGLLLLRHFVLHKPISPSTVILALPLMAVLILVSADIGHSIATYNKEHGSK